MKRTRQTACGFLLALAVAGAACSSTKASAPTDSARSTVPACAALGYGPEQTVFVGKSLAKAQSYAASHDLVVRVVIEDGHSLDMLANGVSNRIDVITAKGRVVEACRELKF